MRCLCNNQDRLNVFGKNAQLMRLIRDLVDGDGSEVRAGCFISWQSHAQDFCFVFFFAIFLYGQIKFEIFQSTAFMKPAKIGREKPWHQGQTGVITLT